MLPSILKTSDSESRRDPWLFSGRTELERLALSPEQAKRVQFHKGRGCRHCRNTGYSGRVAIYELMVMNTELRDAIAAGRNSQEVRQVALRTGMKSLKYDGLVKVNQGITSAQEVINVATGIALGVE